MGESKLPSVLGGGSAEPPGKKRSTWLIGSLALLVIVLAAAAYVGGRWLTRAAAGAGGGSASGKMQLTANGKTFSIEPAGELPQSSPDLNRVLVRRQDNSLFLGTGKVTQLVHPGPAGGQASAPTYDGPVLEAVVTHDTQIYRDETNFDVPPPGDRSGKIQQVVKPVALGDIPIGSVIQVWGQKTGDRTVARIVVYQPG